MTNTHYRRLLVRRVIATHACAVRMCSAEVFAVCSSATHGQDAGEHGDATVGVGGFSGDCLVCQGLKLHSPGRGCGTETLLILTRVLCRNTPGSHFRSGVTSVQKLVH